MLRSRVWSSLLLLAACGRSALLGDEPTTAAVGQDDDGDAATSHATSEDTDSPPSPSGDDDAYDDGPGGLDLASPGTSAGPPSDVGTSDGVCTDAACFGPAEALDEAPAWAIAVVDLDADGIEDVVAGGEGRLRILSQSGNVTTIDVLGRVIAIATGPLDADGVGDLVALTDAARVVVVKGGATPSATSLAAADGLTDVAIPASDGILPAFVTVAREGTVTLWRDVGGSWVPSFYSVDASPNTVAVGRIEADALVIAAGDDLDARVDVLAVDGQLAASSAAYPYFDNDPVQIETGSFALPGAIPDLVVLGDDPPALEIHRFSGGIDSLYASEVLPFAGKPRAFATGGLGFGEEDVAVVDELAGTVELCALVVDGAYAPTCPGTVLSVGATPVAIAIGELVGGAPDDIVVASPETGVTLLPGSSAG